jgi:nickel transport protein
MKRKILFVPVMAAMLFPAMLSAHGVEVSLVTNTGDFQSETVSFMYSTGEAMSFAIIRVYAPSSPDVETVQSITDRNGYFSFVPDEAGEWRITAEDGMGHKGTITVLADAAGEEFSGAERLSGVKSKAPIAFRITLGLSLILNVFAVYNFVLKKCAPKKDSSNAH